MTSFVRRYTSLPFLLHSLKNKRLTLLSPSLWDDRNDSYYVELYQKSRNAGSVLALCMTTASETYHHWKVFAPGTSGVCVDFDKQKLLDWSKSVPRLTARPVEYRKLDAIRATRPPPDELPFVKRFPFRDEREFRLIYEHDDADAQYADLEFDLKMIDKIVVNPWLPESVFLTVKDAIRALDRCQRLKVNRTTLVNNERWQRYGQPTLAA